MVSGKLQFYIFVKKELTFLTNIPATRSRTTTLLRLHPNYQFLNRLNKVKSSSETNFLHVTGGVYKANLHVHRNMLICDY